MHVPLHSYSVCVHLRKIYACYNILNILQISEVKTTYKY